MRQKRISVFNEQAVPSGDRNYNDCKGHLVTSVPGKCAAANWKNSAITYRVAEKQKILDLINISPLMYHEV